MFLGAAKPMLATHGLSYDRDQATLAKEYDSCVANMKASGKTMAQIKADTTQYLKNANNVALEFPKGGHT